MACEEDNRQMTIDEAIQHAEDASQRMLSNCNTHKCGEEHQQLVDWLKELKELRSKYKVAIQMCADYDNYKKRVQKQLTSMVNEASKNVLAKLLPVVDDFERVQESMKTYESNPVIEGINLVYSNFVKVLNDEGCEKLDCKIGDKFDVNFHEAVAVLPHEPGQVNSGSIAQIMQQGWTLNGNLLRAAKVIVRQ